METSERQRPACATTKHQQREQWVTELSVAGGQKKWKQEADQSGVGYEAHVLLQVYLQAAGAREGFGALHAAVRPLAGVSPFVLLHGVAIAERTTAERAAVRPLARVDAQVPAQIPSLAEALGTKGAAVRPLARVRAQVSPQVRRLRKRLAAPVAGVRLPLLLQVQAQAGGLAERLAAARAAVHQFRNEARDGSSIAVGRRHLLSRVQMWLLRLRSVYERRFLANCRHRP